MLTGHTNDVMFSQLMPLPNNVVYITNNMYIALSTYLLLVNVYVCVYNWETMLFICWTPHHGHTIGIHPI